MNLPSTPGDNLFLSSIAGQVMDLLFEPLPIGTALFDTQFRLVRANPTWIGLLERYTGTPADQALPGKSIFELSPVSETLFQSVLGRVLAGETVQSDRLRIESGGLVSYWNGTFTPVRDGESVVAIFYMVVDITERVLADQRRMAAEGLREILRVINSNRPLPEVLDTIAYQSNQILRASSTMIRHVSLADEAVTTVASCNLPPEFDQIHTQPFYRQHSDQLLLERKPVVTDDVPAAYLPRLGSASFTDPLQRAGLEATVKYYKSMLKAPLFIRGQIYGAITFHFEQPRQFSDEELELSMTLADQAALAIENARLIDQVKETAVVEERTRLARELHDAVTQTLFSTTLVAEVLPRIWERSPAEGRKKLDELRELTRGALAEMRTLLMELRPDALADADLKDLLRHLTHAFTARARVPVQLALPGSQETEALSQLPFEVKVNFYRIAQEALNNISKHAEASQVTVTLACQEEQVEMLISDDGQGFDAVQASGADHYGLRIMRERAEQASAQIEITSQANQGTQVRLLWTRPQATPDPTQEQAAK